VRGQGALTWRRSGAVALTSPIARATALERDHSLRRRSLGRTQRMAAARAWLGPHWPLLALVAVAVLARFGTLGVQSFWYDEAYTPVHVLHRGLGATLRSVVHTENNPPLWYVLVWAWSRVLGSGVLALRSLSALAGVGTVAVAWAMGRELGTRRTAVVLAGVVAVNPLFVWYSQEARPYALFALLGASSLLLFLRCWREPSPRRLAAWSAVSVLAVLSHYFAVFEVGAEALLLLALLIRPLRERLIAIAGAVRAPPARNAVLLAVAALVACGLALAPLVLAQGGQGTQWIGRWPLSARLVAIPGYYLLGGQSSAFGHGLLLACLLPLLAAVGLLPGLERREWRAVTLLGLLGAACLVLPLALALSGADYLAPRNVIVAWVPLTAVLAVVLSGRQAGRAGTVLAALICAVAVAVLVLIDLSPRLQRGDWQGVAAALTGGVPDRAVVTVELGSAPLEYYRPGLRTLSPSRSALVSEVDLVGYRPLRTGTGRAPAPGFRLIAVRSAHGLLVYRFVAAAPVRLPERLLRSRTITATRSETLIASGTPVG